MRFELKITFIVFVSCVNLFSQDLAYRVFDKEVDKFMIVNAQKRTFEKFFSDTLLSWKDEGLYLFVDEKNAKRLIVLNKKNMAKIFTIPKVKRLPWIETEKYFEELDALCTKNKNEGRFSEIIVDSTIVNSIMKIRVWNLPYVTIYKHYHNLPMIDKMIISGIYKEEAKESLFYFKKIENEERLKKPLDVFDDFFEILDKSPFLNKK